MKIKPLNILIIDNLLNKSKIREDRITNIKQILSNRGHTVDVYATLPINGSAIDLRKYNLAIANPASCDARTIFCELNKRSDFRTMACDFDTNYRNKPIVQSSQIIVYFPRNVSDYRTVARIVETEDWTDLKEKPSRYLPELNHLNQIETLENF